MNRVFPRMPVPDASQVRIDDVAHALSNICRFNGHTRPFFSVLHHSLEVSALCRAHAERFGVNARRAALAGLMHDAPEYVVGDVVSPMKRRLGNAFRDVYNEAERVVYAALDVAEVAEECAAVVEWADREMLVSDAFRWRARGTITDSAGNSYTIPEDGSRPEGLVIHFPDAKPLGPGEGTDEFVLLYRSLKESIR
jgi:HD superfamily phosphodiesterase